MRTLIKRFLEKEASAGLLLMAVAVAAMLVANSPLAPFYNDVFATKTLASLTINDGLMAIFFMLIGLEIKREIVAGELSTRKKALLPFAAAIGGVIAPALIYSYFNAGTYAAKGWAIPAATDIAFSLGVLSLFGKHVPTSLKIFLMALAVIDDLIAVIIIAIFYTASINLIALGAAFFVIILLYALAKRKNTPIAGFVAAGLMLWLCILLSGVHATIAGVLLGLLIPMRHNQKLIDALHTPVAFIIVPIFAFANAGVSLTGFDVAALYHPVSMGIMIGLVVGKPVGICLITLLVVSFKWAKLPSNATILQFFAISMMAGIGFTMSLFIAILTSNAPDFSHAARLGIIMGSLVAGLSGAFILWIANKMKVIKS